MRWPLATLDVTPGVEPKTRSGQTCALRGPADVPEVLAGRRERNERPRSLYLFDNIYRHKFPPTFSPTFFGNVRKWAPEIAPASVAREREKAGSANTFHTITGHGFGWPRDRDAPHVLNCGCASVGMTPVSGPARSGDRTPPCTSRARALRGMLAETA